MAARRIASKSGVFNVYYVSCAVTGMGYVGITSWPIAKRFKRHTWNAKQGRHGDLYDAMRLHGPQAFNAEMLQQVTSWDDACEAERKLIVELDTKIPNGFNLTGGGDGNFGYEYTDEVRSRMSASGKKRRLTQPHRDAIGAAHKGRTRSEESKEIQRVAMTGRAASAETKVKMSATRLGKKRPNISIALQGKKLTPEHVANMRTGMAGKKRSPDSFVNFSEAGKRRIAARRARGEDVKPPSWQGKKHSPETIEKMRAAWARRRAKANGTGQSQPPQPPQQPQEITTMIVTVETEVVMPAGAYVLGDPCYSVPNYRWDELMTATDCFRALPIGRLGGHDILAFSTYNGDGIFDGPNGSRLGVDSGLIGLVPVDLPRRRESRGGFTVTVAFDKLVTCRKYSDGVLEFGEHRIATKQYPSYAELQQMEAEGTLRA